MSLDPESGRGTDADRDHISLDAVAGAHSRIEVTRDDANQRTSTETSILLIKKGAHGSDRGG